MRNVNERKYLKELEILKLTDLVTLHNALLVYHYRYNLLPSSFEIFFLQQHLFTHTYTRLASKLTYYINTIKTNYGKFNIRFAAAIVWNHLDESIKHLPLKAFKNKVKSNILQSYCSRVFNWYLFTLLSIFFCLFIYFKLFLLTNRFPLLKLQCRLSPLSKHYLVLLSSISFLVILSKHYLSLY